MTYISICFIENIYLKSWCLWWKEICEDTAELLILGEKNLSFPALERWDFSVCPLPSILKPSCSLVKCSQMLTLTCPKGTAKACILAPVSAVTKDRCPPSYSPYIPYLESFPHSIPLQTVNWSNSTVCSFSWRSALLPCNDCVAPSSLGNFEDTWQQVCSPTGIPAPYSNLSLNLI